MKTGVLSDHPAALRLDGICLHYGAVRALADVSLSVGQGEFLTLLGPSGSGKTSCLRVIAGFIQPDAGRLFIDGRDMTRVAPQRRNIGMVFQDYALFPHMSALENVCYPLAARGVDRRERQKRGAAMLETVGLAGHAQRRPRELSGGQQQRVALARALVFNPAIVLLDEPMAALDKKLRGQMQWEILHIARQAGATVVSVTHDQEEALVMSDRIAVFKDGRLAQIGSPQALYTQPRSAFVADFIGEANLLRGRVRTHANRLLIDGPGWRSEVSRSHAHAATLTNGQAVCLVVRPERIGVTADDAAMEEGNNGAAGVLEDRIYLGVEYRLVVRTQGDVRIQVRSRDVAHVSVLNPGARVRLSWSDADVVIIAEQGQQREQL